jgi:acetoin utilization deacetylase AcuC-like enzyme
MKVVTHNDFLQVYVNDPAAAPGRIESVLDAIRDEVTFEEALTAGEDEIAAVHGKWHIQDVTQQRLYKISALAAGAAIQTALIGMEEPCFGLLRPPGHHASADHAWGFCYFNNMAIALEHLRLTGRIKKAHVLDFDMHYGDGTVNILSRKGYVSIHNPRAEKREDYLAEVSEELARVKVDVIGVSAGFDNHVDDWGRVLQTEDYQAMGKMVLETAKRLGAGCFALLEGGYNHRVLGQNVRAFLRGLQGL